MALDINKLIFKNIGFPYIACLGHFAKINSFATREEIEGVKELEHITTRLMDGSNNGSSTHCEVA